MKKNIVFLLLLLISNVTFSQDIIRYLVITEVRMDAPFHAYIELTNMGDVPVNLDEFELGRLHPFRQPWNPIEGHSFQLPSRILFPGESFLIANAYDYNPEQYPLDPDNFREKITKDDHLLLADLLIHQPESQGEPGDEVSENYLTTQVWQGRDTWFLKHDNGVTSEVVDQVNGVFDEPDGTTSTIARDVAGVPEALADHILVRKSTVNVGNVDFNLSRGIGPEDSEWIPIPILQGRIEPERSAFWTLGNHGAYELNETSLNSSSIDIDWNNSILTVPWGIRNNDDIMLEFGKHYGLAWRYIFAHNKEDSSYISCRTGDALTIYVAGDQLYVKNFSIIVSPPTADANTVIPKNTKTISGAYSYPQKPLFEVTREEGVMDTIKKVPDACRIDTLFKYLEKPDNATWEVIWVDGQERVDLKNGDILRVTAEDLSARDYYIKTFTPRPGHNALLSSIVWPDIPAYLKNTNGWTEDTIPGFDPIVFDYRIDIPADYEDIPAFQVSTTDPNATVEIFRATHLRGTAEDKTMTIKVTAEDGTTINNYTVVLNKLRQPEDRQEYRAEPFISEYIFREQLGNNFIEISNPGNTPIDLRNYMIVGGRYNSVEEAILSNSQPEDSNTRYEKYVPGFKWGIELEWDAKPGWLLPDPLTNPIVWPGDVFVITHITNTNLSGYPWYASDEADIDFGNNPWNETIEDRSSCANQLRLANIYLFRIDEDSIREGLKPATDPDDFTLIDVFGSGDGSAAVIGGTAIAFRTSYIRKPNYFQGNPIFKASFGTNPDDSEWIVPDERGLLVAKDIGRHSFYPVTDYLSTITSKVYTCSEGYSTNETIKGVVTGTNVNEFLSNIIRQDENQTLTLLSGIDNSHLSISDILSSGDKLSVQSANGENVTRYILEVTSEGLNDDAHLTSVTYTISDNGVTGSITGFDFGTELNMVVNSVNLPQGAKMTVLNSEGEPVPLTYKTGEGNYQNTLVGTDLYFEVIAENGIDKITYQLLPSANANEAYVISNVYNVSNKDRSISTLPEGIHVSSFLDDIIPVNGAILAIKDKFGYDRSSGIIAADDLLQVISHDRTNTLYYFLNSEIESSFEQDIILTIFPGQDLEICEGESVNLAVNGDFYGGYTISWNNGISDGVDFTPAFTDDYIVTVTNAFGSNYDTIRVTVFPLPISDLPNVDVCLGEEVTLTATGGEIYTWDKGIINGTPFIPSITDEYHVTITNSNGCIQKDTVLVNVNPLPEIDAGEDTEICMGEEVTLSASGDPGFTWDKGVEDGVAFSPELTEEYHVSIINVFGCSATDTVVVIVNPLPSVDAGSDQEICLGEPVVLTATSIGAFTWDNDVQDGIAFTPEQTTEYHVTASSLDGCINSDTVIVVVNPLPAINGGADLEICQGEEVTLIATGDPGFTWDNEVEDGVAFSPQSTSQYHLSVTNEHGCENRDTVNILVHEVPSLNAGADLIICMGDEITLDAVSDAAFIWNNAIENGVAFTPDQSSEYYATATTDFGCSTTDTVIVTVNPTPDANAGPDIQTCSGESVTLMATGGITYIWENGISNGESFVPVGDVTLNVTVTNEFGCVDTDELKITINDVDVSVTKNDNILIANATDASFQWIDCLSDEIIDGATNKSYVATENGTYAVEVTQNGCSEISSCYQITGVGTGQTQNITPINYYPNPVTDYLSINLGKRCDEVIIKLYDPLGKMLFNQKFYDVDTVELEMGKLTKGLYFVEVINQEQSKSLRIIKSN